MGRIVGLAVVALVAVSAVVLMFGPKNHGLAECESPVLAASQDAVVAISCAETIAYQGTIYYIDCERVHPSRQGEVFLEDGGETRFERAREIAGVPRGDGFVVESEDPYCGKKTSVALSDSFTRLQAGLLSVPLGAQDELALARQRRPWIVPGRNEIPDRLALEAVLEENTIVFTNRNHFEWRHCNQLQIDAPDDGLAVWEAKSFPRLEAGASYVYDIEEFSRDRDDIEELSADGAQDLLGQRAVVICRAPGGRALGTAALR